MACAANEACTAGDCRPANDALETATPWVFGATGETRTIEGTLANATPDRSPIMGSGCVVGSPNVWYRLDILQRTVVLFDTRGSTDDFGTDTYLRITDATGTTLARDDATMTLSKEAFNDDDGCGTGALDSLLAWSFTDPGTYYLAVSSCNVNDGFHLREEHLFVDELVDGNYGDGFEDGSIRVDVENGVGNVEGVLGSGVPRYDSCVIASATNEQDGFWFASCGNSESPAELSVCTSDGGSWTYGAGTDPVLSLVAANAQAPITSLCVDDLFSGNCAPADDPTQYATFGSRISYVTPRGLYLVVVENRDHRGSAMPYTLAFENTR